MCSPILLIKVISLILSYKGMQEAENKGPMEKRNGREMG
jgi:hypothetical protein